MLSGTNCRCKGDAMATEPLAQAVRHRPLIRLPKPPLCSRTRQVWQVPYWASSANRPNPASPLNPETPSSLDCMCHTAKRRRHPSFYTVRTYHGYKFGVDKFGDKVCGQSLRRLRRPCCWARSRCARAAGLSRPAFDNRRRATARSSGCGRSRAAEGRIVV
jgi:hypothetical protein